jgi:hypothetical protein
MQVIKTARIISKNLPEHVSKKKCGGMEPYYHNWRAIEPLQILKVIETHHSSEMISHLPLNLDAANA